MPRPFWKGYLKRSLVTCPVAMTPATTDSEKVRFHAVSRKTGRRVESRHVDSETGKTVAPDEIAKAHAVGEEVFAVIREAMATTGMVGIEGVEAEESSSHPSGIGTGVPGRARVEQGDGGCTARVRGSSDRLPRRSP